jgi:hypothetical protein
MPDATTDEAVYQRPVSWLQQGTMRHPLILRPTLALAAAFLACSAPAAIADPPEHVFQGHHLPGSHANVHEYTNRPHPVHVAPTPAPAAPAASDSDFDVATAGIAGGAAFALGAALSSLLVITRTRPRPGT